MLSMKSYLLVLFDAGTQNKKVQVLFLIEVDICNIEVNSIDPKRNEQILESAMSIRLF